MIGCGGTISAEHGVGTAKARWLAAARGAEEVAAMRAIKAALDPGGLLNAGVVLTASESADADAGSRSWRPQMRAQHPKEDLVPIKSKLSETVESLTSDEANTDVPDGVSVPATEDGAVPRPDREPMAGFEPEDEADETSS